MNLNAITLAITRPGGVRSWDPLAMFTSGVQGVWHDPSDLTTLYRDAAGTQPVTAVEQPVGLMLDKSKGLVLGPELVTNGDFSNGATGWTTPSGWGVSAGVMNKFAGVANALTQTISSTTAKWYRVSATVVRNSGTLTVSIGTSGTASGSISASGAYTWTLLAGSGTQDLYFTADASFAGSIDNISVRELPGNHAFNSSGNSANFPVLSARYNLLTKTEDFSDVVWDKFSSSISANTGVSPDGSQTADKLIPSTASAIHYIEQTTTLSTAGHTLRVVAKADGYNFVALGERNGTAWAYFNLSNGTIGNTAGSPVTSITSIGNGWYECSITFTSAGGNKGGFVLCDSSNGSLSSWSGNGTSGIYIWGADLRVANDALNQPAYQRVNTATDYDTVGFKPYLRFNGTNQWLQTNSIDFTYGDKMFVSAGVRRLVDSPDGVFAELGANANSGRAFYLAAPGGGGKYGWLSAGSTIAVAQFGGTVAPITNVLSGIGNISGDQAILRVNGSQAAISTADQGTGNYGNYPIYIGARAGTSLWFNGRLYQMVVAGKQASAAEITSTETYLNQKTGAF